MTRRRSLTLVATLAALVVVGCTNVEPEHTNGAHPDWQHLKRRAVPRVVLPDEYETPYMQPHSTLAWEDGIFLSRDGLHMYAFYAPADIFQYAQHAAEHPVCPDIRLYLRGPQLGMDLVSNPWGCENIMHSDIAYTRRGSTSEPFGEWHLSNMANPYRFDGGFQALDNHDGTIDAVLSVSTDGSLNDIYWARGVPHNPSFSSFSAMPSPINTPGQEDNPHLERLDPFTLVLLFDNHGSGDATTSIKYSMSTDDGMTWSEPLELGRTINAGPHDLHPHLYQDGDDWWLYFASERDGQLSIYRSRHHDSRHIRETFDSWGPAEMVIAPGVIEDGSGFMAGVGEPTLTVDGDISFAVVYIAEKSSSPFDKVDIDPWFLPRRRPPQE